MVAVRGFCIVGDGGGETVICISRDSKSFAHLRPVISTGAIGWRPAYLTYINTETTTIRGSMHNIRSEAPAVWSHKKAMNNLTTWDRPTREASADHIFNNATETLEKKKMQIGITRYGFMLICVWLPEHWTAHINHWYRANEREYILYILVN